MTTTRATGGGGRVRAAGRRDDAFVGGFLRLAAIAAATGMSWLGAQGAPAPVAGAAPADPASVVAAKRQALPRASLPAANFLVEWRLRQADATPAHGDIVITSGSATVGGASGYGPGAVVVGTARAAVPQAVRVANGKEGSIQFDRSETHLVYDMSYAASASARSSTDASAGTASGVPATGASRSRSQSREQGASGHDVVVHRVDGLRVTPRWTQGDTLELDLQLTHATPVASSGMTSADSRSSREIDFHSTVQVSFDEWLGVATVGEGGEELQVRVSWR